MSVEAPAKSGFYDCRDAFAATLEGMAADDPRIAAVVNDSVNSTKLDNFAQNIPRASLTSASTTRTAARAAEYSNPQYPPKCEMSYSIKRS
jgi:hypothetical protein